MEDMVMNEVKRAFNPEFLDRAGTKWIIFHPLGDEDLAPHHRFAGGAS